MVEIVRPTREAAEEESAATKRMLQDLNIEARKLHCKRNGHDWVYVLGDGGYGGSNPNAYFCRNLCGAMSFDKKGSEAVNTRRYGPPEMRKQWPHNSIEQEKGTPA